MQLNTVVISMSANKYHKNIIQKCQKMALYLAMLKGRKALNNVGLFVNMYKWLKVEGS